MHSQGNHKQDERQCSEWEKIFSKEAIDKELISKIYKQLMELKIKKKKNKNKQTIRSKNGWKILIDISLKMTYGWPKDT